jgi:prepilin-type N-terminal cleavage/methylation domain-containing protein
MNARCHVARRREAGYSLPELLTVIAIIGVLALVTVPSFINFFQSSKVKTTMRNFTTDLRKMRALAISQNLETKLSYATGANARTYTLYVGNSAMGTPSAQAWTRLDLTTPKLGAGTKTLDTVVNFPANSGSTPQTFDDIDNSGDIDVVFYPDGRVLMPAASKILGTITIQTPLTKVTVPKYQIDISPAGRVLAH